MEQVGTGFIVLTVDGGEFIFMSGHATLEEAEASVAEFTAPEYAMIVEAVRFYRQR
jgi:hypothetical protein